MVGGTTLESPRAPAEGRLREEDLLSALPNRSTHREAKVGLFVLAGILAFLIALFSLTDVGTFRGRYYATTIIENAGGMRAGDPVQMRGVNIGRVTSFQMVPDGVAVTMEIYNRYSVPEDSRVTVRSAGLLGGMVVDLVPGQSANRVRRDQVLAGGVEEDMMTAATGLGVQAEEVLGRANLLLSEGTIGSIGASASELQSLLVELNALAAAQRQEMALLTGSLRSSAEGIERAAAGPELENAVANIEALTARLDGTTQTLAAASSSLEAILGRLERGEGTLGRLTADDQLYDNMNDAVLSVQALVADIQRDPRRYINLRIF